jgi:hypothetical protein
MLLCCCVFHKVVVKAGELECEKESSNSHPHSHEFWMKYNKFH